MYDEKRVRHRLVTRLDTLYKFGLNKIYEGENEVNELSNTQITAYNQIASYSYLFFKYVSLAYIIICS